MPKTKTKTQTPAQRMIQHLIDEQVKFKDAAGRIYFGTVTDPFDEFGEYYKESKRAYNKSLALVKDAVTPELYQVPYHILEVIPVGKVLRPKFGFLGFFPTWDDEFNRYQTDEGNKALVASEKASGNLVVGAMFRIPVVDGQAYYVVTAIKRNKCLVEHRHFGGDNWQDHYFGLGGWFSIKEVAPYVLREHELNDIFKSQQ